MVHALEEIHRVLRPDGTLIDIHPFAEPPQVKVIENNRILFAEPKREGDHEGIQSADRAVAQVLGRKLFVAERNHDFDFFSYASSVPELRDFWDSYNAFNESPKELAFLEYEDEVFARAEAVLRGSGEDAEAVIHERVGITRLTRVGR